MLQGQPFQWRPPANKGIGFTTLSSPSAGDVPGEWPLQPRWAELDNFTIRKQVEKKWRDILLFFWSPHVEEKDSLLMIIHRFSF